MNDHSETANMHGDLSSMAAPLPVESTCRLHQQGSPCLATELPLEVLHLILPHLVSPRSLVDLWYLARTCKRLYTQLWESRYYRTDSNDDDNAVAVSRQEVHAAESWSVVLRALYDPVCDDGDVDPSFHDHHSSVVGSSPSGIQQKWRSLLRDKTIARQRLEFFRRVCYPIERRDHTLVHRENATQDILPVNDPYYSFGPSLDMRTLFEMSAQHVTKNLGVIAANCAEENWSFFLSQAFLVGITAGKSPTSPFPVDWPSPWAPGNLNEDMQRPGPAANVTIERWRSCIVSEICRLIAQLACQDIMTLTSIHENEYRSMEWLAGLVFDRLAYAYDSLQSNPCLLRWPILLMFQLLFCGSIGSTLRMARQSTTSAPSQDQNHHQPTAIEGGGGTGEERQRARTASSSSTVTTATISGVTTTTRRRNLPRTHYVPIWFNSAVESHSGPRKTVYQRVVPIPLVPPPFSTGLDELYQRRILPLSPSSQNTAKVAVSGKGKRIQEQRTTIVTKTTEKTGYRLLGTQWRGFYAYQELEIVNDWPRDEEPPATPSGNSSNPESMLDSPAARPHHHHQHRRSRSLQMHEPSRYNHFLPRKAPSKLWVKAMRSTRLDGCMDAYLFEEVICSDAGDRNRGRHSQRQQCNRRVDHNSASHGSINNCCRPRYLTHRQHAQDMIDVDRHFARLRQRQDYDGPLPPPPPLTTAGGGGGGGDGDDPPTRPTEPRDEILACDDLRRRSNWRHQILFSGHGRDACGHFGIRGILSQRTGLVRFIKTYFIPPPVPTPQQQHPHESGLASATTAVNGYGNEASAIVAAGAVAGSTAYLQGYDGRDPWKRTPGQWVFVDGMENEERRDGNIDVIDSEDVDADEGLNGGDDDFWDVDTFGWCYRGYLDDGGVDSIRDERANDIATATDETSCPRQPTSYSLTTPTAVDTAEKHISALPGGVGILGKWCDVHGGGPFWLFHREIDI